MASKDYEILLSKYNICLTERNDLREQLKTKNEQWQERDREFEITKKLTRELCEMILAKDMSQMTLGKQKSWSSIAINDLINMAKGVFREYNNRRNNFMERMADDIESLQKKLADTRNEVLFYKQRANTPVSTPMTSEEISQAAQLEEAAEQALEKQKKKEEGKKAVGVKSLDPKVQTAVEKGNIRVEQIKKAETVKEGIRSGEAIAIVEEEDVATIDGHLHEKNIRRNVEMNISKTTPTTMRAIRTPELQKEYRKKQQNIEDEYDKDRLQGISKNIMDIGWLVIKVFGETGCSRVSELVNMVVDEGAKQKILTNERAAYGMVRDLARIGVFFAESVITPKGSIRVVTFTRDGSNLYRMKYGEKPVIFSEADRLRREHGSLEHGYCILQCAEVIRESKFFQDVSIYNRKKPVRIESSQLEFVPDIICKDENGRVLLVEYELDHYDQRDFNGKTKKILLASDTANWITSNQKILDSLVEKTKKLLKEEGESFLFKDKVIRLTTVANIKGLDLRQDQNWKYVFYPSKGTEPTVNF